MRCRILVQDTHGHLPFRFRTSTFVGMQKIFNKGHFQSTSVKIPFLGKIIYKQQWVGHADLDQGHSIVSLSRHNDEAWRGWLASCDCPIHGVLMRWNPINIKSNAMHLTRRTLQRGRQFGHITHLTSQSQLAPIHISRELTGPQDLASQLSNSNASQQQLVPSAI